MNFRGKKRNSPGEGIELVSLNSLGRAPIGRTARKRTSSKSNSSKGIEMIEFNKGRKRRTTSSKSSSGRSSGRSSRKGRKVSNKPYDEVLSLTETASSSKRGSLSLSNSSTLSSPFQNLKSSPSSSTKKRASLRELEESLSLSPLTGSPGRSSPKRRGG